MTGTHTEPDRVAARSNQSIPCPPWFLTVLVKSQARAGFIRRHSDGRGCFRFWDSHVENTRCSCDVSGWERPCVVNVLLPVIGIAAQPADQCNSQTIAADMHVMDHGHNSLVWSMPGIVSVIPHKRRLAIRWCPSMAHNGRSGSMSNGHPARPFGLTKPTSMQG